MIISSNLQEIRISSADNEVAYVTEGLVVSGGERCAKAWVRPSLCLTQMHAMLIKSSLQNGKPARSGGLTKFAMLFGLPEKCQNASPLLACLTC